MTASPETIYWIGTEDEQHIARMKACKARRKEWGEDDCDEKDGSCAECEMDMAYDLRVTKEQWEAAGCPE